MGSGSGRHLLVGGWSQLASLLRKGYLPPTRARACVRVRVSEGTRLHSPNFSFFFFFLLEASWWMWLFLV